MVENFNLNGISPSRLLTETADFRNTIIARNLYTPISDYSLSNISSNINDQNTINAVNSITDTISPLVDLSNTIYSSIVTDKTPLTEIGLVMLGNQIAYNSIAYITQQTTPILKPLTLFNGLINTNITTEAINYQITPRPNVTNFQNFVNAVVSFNPNKDYPFTSEATNADLIKNSGTGQLSFLYQALNQNIYKQGFSNSYNDSILNMYGLISLTPLTRRNTIINAFNSNYHNYYNFFISNPYSTINPNFASIDGANNNVILSMNTSIDSSSLTQEYAPNADYIKNNFGSTTDNSEDVKLSQTENTWVTNEDDPNVNQIVWGMTGISPIANDKIDDLRGNTLNNQNFTSDLSNFHVNNGLLNYTKNLLNASEGAIIDTTRKIFVKGQTVAGFNGSALWVANNSTYAQNSGIANKTGTRQHTSLDQYDRFAKAIRFNGNTVYGGNENSVIFNSVIPRIHPTLNKDNTVNNKNLMFSIENLAVKVISSGDGVGIIDDQFGSTIPISEVGNSGGRLMWFPPYNVELNETTSSKYDSTVMVGRNEPIYSYQYSERSATLTFTLLVDYPDNLKNYKGTDKHRVISEFFAFGGDAYAPLSPVSNTVAKNVSNQQQIQQITGPTTMAEPDVIPAERSTIVFPNDFPNVDQIQNAIDTMYVEYNYEIQNNLVQSNGLIGNGLNKNIYVIDPNTILTDPNNKRQYLDDTLLPVGFSQYTQTGSTGLNNNLRTVYSNINNRKYYDITITGGASLLYIEANPNNPKQSKYNQALGLRRANAAKVLVEERIKVLFGDTPDKLGINVQLNPNNGGSTGSSLADLNNATVAKEEEVATKQERYALIEIKRNTIPIDKKVQPIPISAADQANINTIQNDIATNSKISKNQTNNQASANVYNERTAALNNDSGDGAILKGFRAVSDNYFYPVFHSQTPEDFHRRLTFLQQSMRQGAAKTNNNTGNDNLSATNSVFGRQPICIFRYGDFFFTKVIIENLNIDYTETTWDMNPEGFGMQPLMAKVTLQMKVLGGQSLKGAIDALQNAVSFNYYANSTFTNAGMYFRPSTEADNQASFNAGVNVSNAIGTNVTDVAAMFNGFGAIGGLP